MVVNSLDDAKRFVRAGQFADVFRAEQREESIGPGARRQGSSYPVGIQAEKRSTPR
jgi:hypothetical protein